MFVIFSWFKMSYTDNRIGVLRDLHPDIEVMFNRLSLSDVRGNLPGHTEDNGMLRGADRVLANNILLRNEIYDLFKCFYRHPEKARVLESTLGNIGELPFLQIIAGRMEVEVEEQRKAIESAMGGFSDAAGRNF